MSKGAPLLITSAAPAGVKVILETSLLSRDEKVMGCTLSKAAGADFVKTSTGKIPVAATPESVATMALAVARPMPRAPPVTSATGRRRSAEASPLIAEVFLLNSRPMTWQKFAVLRDIPQGTRKHVVHAGHEYMLLHTKEGIYCIDHRCPHADGSVGDGMALGGFITCPLHKWRFDLCDGSHSHAGTRTLGVYQVRIDGEEVQVETL